MKCRLCSEILLDSDMCFDEMPYANAYRENKNIVEHKHWLQLSICPNCKLIQHNYEANPSELFTDYAYFSSVSNFWLEHAKKFVDTVLNKFNENQIKVLEIASNDGYLLREFLKLDHKALGIEPAKNIAIESERNGVKVIPKFFGKDLVNEIKRDFGMPDLIVANNVMAHAPDINDILSGVRLLMNRESIFTVEFPHAHDMIIYNEFDTIYHEHFFYFTLHSFQNALEKHDLKVLDVEKLKSHGGSLRIYAVRNDSVQKVNTLNIADCLDSEIESSSYKIESLNLMSINANKIKEETIRFINEKHNDGLKISAIGAAAKGNTFTNFIGKEFINKISDIYDETKFKKNKYYPGTNIKIKNPINLNIDRPDILIILPWNHKDEIISRYKIIRDWGGKFVTFIPSIHEY